MTPRRWLPLLGCCLGCSQAFLFPHGSGVVAGDVASAAQLADAVVTDAQDATATSQPDAGPADAATPAKAAQTGYWVQHAIGNCIDFEEWLRFDLPAGFVRTLVNRDACGPHDVTTTPGQVKLLPNQVLRYGWQDDQGERLERQTIAVVDPYPVPADANQAGYVAGHRALNRMAYAQTAPGTYARDSGSAWPSGVATSLQLTLTFSEPLVNVAVATPCTLKVDMVMSAMPGAGGPQLSGAEQFTLPCTAAPQPQTGWIRVVANGFEDSQSSDAWSKFFDAHGWWQKYPAQLSNTMYDSFRPVLYFQPGRPETLFHDVSHAWYVEMLSPPPLSVP